MSLIIPDDVWQAAGMSSAELKQDIAVLLFARNKLTLGRAAHLAEMHQLQFQHLLASRGIPLHYDVADFDADVQTLRHLGRL